MTDATHRFFLGVSSIFEGIFPKLAKHLRQSYSPEDVKTYMSKTILLCIVNFLLVFALMNVVVETTKNDNKYFAPGVAFAVAVFMFYSRLMKPSLIVKRRVKDIEKNLAFATQSLYIQVSSGIPVYNALVAVARGRYGSISSEFKITIDDISAGKPMVEALEDLSMRNPSPYFQKIVWQMINTMSTGGSLKDNLDDIVKTISRDQMTSLKTYGARLSPLSMAYMLVAVILPSLGITVLITISSLPNMSANLSENVLWMLLGFALIMQTQFIMIIGSTRPNLIGD